MIHSMYIEDVEDVEAADPDPNPTETLELTVSDHPPREVVEPRF